MWSAQHEPAGSPGAVRTRVHAGAEPLVAGAALALLRTEPAFADFLSGLLTASEHRACFWELPPLTRDTLDRGLEFVVTPAPAIAPLPPEPDAFAEHLEAAAGRTATFRSLGGDALLVAPAGGPGTDCAHLLAFLRSAPAGASRDLWRAVGEAAESELGAEPRWLSTSGLGVAWLHVRVDSTPKYYVHPPYRQWG
jgi:hypothetical protein